MSYGNPIISNACVCVCIHMLNLRIHSYVHTYLQMHVLACNKSHAVSDVWARFRLGSGPRAPLRGSTQGRTRADSSGCSHLPPSDGASSTLRSSAALSGLLGGRRLDLCPKTGGCSLSQQKRRRGRKGSYAHNPESELFQL